ncbi:MAG: transposase [Deltaproteobacteria bacterium]
MIDNDNVYRRRSIRLPGYDYSTVGAYFITICVQNRACLFGRIVGATPRGCPDSPCAYLEPNEAGNMVKAVWDKIPLFYPGIGIDEFVIMPNHIHGIIFVGAPPRGCPDSNGQPQESGQPRGESGQPRGVAPTLSLPDVVHRFKTMTTKRYADGVKEHGWPPFPGRLWQRNYWEHIVRDEIELNLIREYIRNNATQWGNDKLNVGAGTGAYPYAYPNDVNESLARYGEESWIM